MGRIAAILDRQAPNLALWIPVLHACGIGLYFALPAEPPGWLLVACLGPAGLCLALAPRLGLGGRVAVLLLALPLVGFAVAGGRARLVAAPVLDRERTVAIEGRVAGLSRSGADLPRVLLDELWIGGLDPAVTPGFARVSLGPGTDPALLVPGKRITGTARLSPPPGPSEPGGFDFRFVAYFEGLGAIGYTRTPFLEAAASEVSPWRQMAFRARMALSRRIRAVVPGQDGAFGAAILTGDRSGISRATDDALRASTLYHLVSISGLHMGLLAAAVFAIVRHGLALVPWCALRWPLKKLAAVAALIGGFAYLAISGNEVATQRSYVMTAVVLCAVLLDRPALTLRAVALAALVVLTLTPEALVQPGFQMSFAATLALVTVFEALGTRAWWCAIRTDRRWRLARPVIGIAMTSLVAGAATAPVSAFHFNAAAPYGLVANMLAVPMMGLLVMPAAVAGIMAMPFGLDALPLTLMGWGDAYVLGVADFVAGLGGAVRGVPAGPPATLALLGLGGVFVALWRGPGRWLGLLPALAGVALWTAEPRPDLLIAGNGRLFGVMTPGGRTISVAKGNAFTAESWLRRDGDGARQAEAAARGEVRIARGRIEAEAPGIGRILYLGSPPPGRPECDGAAVLIAPRWTAPPEGGCLFVGRDLLAREGAVAIDFGEGSPRLLGARSAAAVRPWSPRPAIPAAAARPAPAGELRAAAGP
ncbi:ComEC/Rec2 family competence protein [Amaricoccus solimangrovi]|uniref:ComEC family competence protein n=1 Tax=Amaricoccus solimangrovi TaxID=2589815 RepID=A0A501WVX4_9RHOB|nr:ComEC/Rec2 family competence protein [Amaricoccus solimangrovi]TPE53568.1 ComEC family competence protein [Amaricoccus solimangrovi]